jgi:ribosomal protein S18 acetylase RimI-like enzyme
MREEAASPPVARQVRLEQTRALRQSVLRPHDSIEEIGAGEATGAYAAGVFDGQMLIAVGTIAPTPERGGWRVRGMATAPEARNRGAGGAVLQALLDHASARGASCVWCNARTPAQRFYERAGFRACSEVFEIAQTGPHVVMERALG